MNQTTWKILGIIAAALFLSFVVVFILNQEEPPEPKPPIPEGERTLQHKLAVTNAGRYVPEDHPTVSEFEDLLDQLESATSNSREEIAELSREGVVQIEEEFDLIVKLLYFMEQAAELAEETETSKNYEEISARTVLKLGKSQEEV